MTIYSLDILLFLFGTSPLFHVQLYCFLTCIQVSQGAGKVLWYFHLFKNFPQFVVIHTVRGFHIVSEAQVIFFNSLAFLMIQQMLAIWSLVPLPFLNPACTFGSSWLTYCWSLAWRSLSITLLAWEMSTLCSSLNILWHCLSLGLEWMLTFSSPGHCWVFQICWHTEYSTFTASSFRIWNSSTGMSIIVKHCLSNLLLW